MIYSRILNLRSAATALLLAVSATVNAQDVIVKADGSTIVSTVLEINPDNIKYKKFSNPDGPTYTIPISDVVSVNYANGDQDKFDAQPAAQNPASEQKQTVSENNAALIASYNEEVAYNGKQKDNEAKMLYCRMGVTEKSVLEDNMARISLKTTYRGASGSYVGDLFNKGEGGSTCTCDKCQMGIEVTVRNLSDRTIYVDLANTFFVRGGEATAYYIPSATSSTESSSSGGAVNLGAVAGAIGLGGAVGTLAGGISVGGSSTNGTTETIYSQRVISIPPQTSKTLEYQPYFHTGDKYDFFDATKRGDGIWTSIHEEVRSKTKLDLPEGKSRKLTESESPCMFGVHVAYSTTEDCSQVQNLHADLYVNEIVGAKKRRAYDFVDMRDFSDNWNSKIYFLARNGE